MANPEQHRTLRPLHSILPSPLAMAVGRVSRARTEVEELDSVLRAGEVLTRYLAALALSSLEARKDNEGFADVQMALAAFNGSLSWGHFLTAIQVIGKSKVDHPLAQPFRGGFAKSSKGGAKADEAITALLNLRNEIGHNLSGMNRAKAQSLIQQWDPLGRFLEALDTVAPLTSLPLFLLEGQELKKKQIIGRRLLLMGDREPIPDEIQLEEGLEDSSLLYLGLRKGALCLDPFLRWDIIGSRSTYGVFMLHRIQEDGVSYHSIDDDACQGLGVFPSCLGVSEEIERAIEPVKLADGRSFFQEWKEENNLRTKKAELEESVPPWNRFDSGAMKHFAQLVGDGEDDPKAIIRSELLDGRDALNSEDNFQLCLLFGDDDLIQELVARTMLDCRATKRESEERWIERVESSSNVLACLATAIDFFSRHVGAGDAVTIDGLKATSGTADYIAMREALVNLFIHQDYQDKRTVAQVVTSEDRTEFHNAGHALVNQRALLEGGKSTSRNPIIARALRLMGFAELAGTGLASVQRAWRQARRRPPVFESDEAQNSFSLRLDWRELPENVDEDWNKRIGVKITAEQAEILSLLADGDSFTKPEIVSATGQYLEDTDTNLRKLKQQGLIIDEDDRFRMAEHLLELIHGNESNDTAKEDRR